MNKLMTKFIVGMALVGGLSSCCRHSTPQRAAEGGMKCGCGLGKNETPMIDNTTEIMAAADNGGTRPVISAPTPTP